MTTLSEDLDFFDGSVFEPLPSITSKHSSSSLNVSKIAVTDDISETEEDSNTKDVSPYPLSVDREVDEEIKSTAEEESEKEIRSIDKFSTALWSESDAASSKTHDSWDLPSGTVPWDESDKPIERLLSYADLSLTKEEENGLLTDRIIAACSSYLTETPENKCHVVAKVSLNNKNLNDIRILGYHRFLQFVDLSWNNLTDLTPLGCIPYLMYLDVSHNLLKEVLRFRPPTNLTYVNYSYNEVWQIDDLTEFWSLSYLDLSHNKISKIQGIQGLRYLRYLDLSHNKIERLQNLSNMRLTDLNLEYNLISKVEKDLGFGVNTMPCLSNLYLNNNLISSLEFLKEVYHLKKLDLQGNNISDLVELRNMKNLRSLRVLDLSGNPISLMKSYRAAVIKDLLALKFLDQIEVELSERVAACSLKRFDVQLEAARHHARMYLLEQLNDTTLNLDVVPVDQASYPFVILVGPSASSKKYIASCLAEKYPEKVHLAKLHTTRKVLSSEQQLFYQTRREEFHEMIKSGIFLCVSEHLGHLYGFSREELGFAIRDHKLCLVALDLPSALTIHGYGIQPCMVLTIPQSREEHAKRLKMTYGPILSMIGAAYMSERQLIDSHESNVKRVEFVLDEITNSALQKIETKESENLNEVDSQSHCSSSSSRYLDLNNEPRTVNFSASSKNYMETVCYDRLKQCYPCSPSACGLQTCLAAIVEDKTPSEKCFEEKRLSASTEDKGEASTTSYSQQKFPDVKMEYSSCEGSSYGEVDLFADWSMPFVNWSEITLTGLQLEEASELLCEKYVESVMVTRDIYENLHQENPGLFSLSVFTDDAPKAIKAITKLLKEVWRSTPMRKPTFDVNDDLVYQAFVPRKLEELKEFLRNDFMSSGDGATECFSNMPIINSPTTICLEMSNKGYGDSFGDTQ